MYVTSRGAPRTGLPFVLPVSFDKIDNNNNNNVRTCIHTYVYTHIYES